MTHPTRQECEPLQRAAAHGHGILSERRDRRPDVSPAQVPVGLGAPVGSTEKPESADGPIGDDDGHSRGRDRAAAAG